jgi:hypothetical protein
MTLLGHGAKLMHRPTRVETITRSSRTPGLSDTLSLVPRTLLSSSMSSSSASSRSYPVLSSWSYALACWDDPCSSGAMRLHILKSKDRVFVHLAAGVPRMICAVCRHCIYSLMDADSIAPSESRSPLSTSQQV